MTSNHYDQSSTIQLLINVIIQILLLSLFQLYFSNQISHQLYLSFRQIMKNLTKKEPRYAKSKSPPRSQLPLSTQISIFNKTMIKPNKEVIEDINKRRVKSYQKISFPIRKMNEMFKKTCDQSIKKDIATNKASKIYKFAMDKYSPQNPKQRMNTFSNFDESPNKKIRKNILATPELIDNSTSNYRRKTQYDNYQKAANCQEQVLTEPQQIIQNKVFSKTCKLLKFPEQQQSILQHKQIPGINFKNNSRSSIRHSHKKTQSSTTFNKTSTYLHIDKLIKGDCDDRISKMNELRQKNDLNQAPKQWQFFNLLQLGNLSLYKSNLKLSCQNWILIDHRQLKFLRAWQHEQIKQIKVASFLFLTYLILQLKKKGLDLSKFKMRLNNKIILRKMHFSRREPSDFTLAQNTIISIQDLLVGLIYSNEIDVFWHLVYFLGFFHEKYNSILWTPQSEAEEYNDYLYITDQSKKGKYEQIFLILCRQACKQYRLNSFTFEYKITKAKLLDKNNRIVRGQSYQHSLLKEYNEQQYLLLKGNCLQTAILFLLCLSSPFFFEKLTLPTSTVAVRIKYQIGFNYWQNRNYTWKRQYNSNYQDVLTIEERNILNKQYSFVFFHRTEHVIAICNDSKVNMQKKDSKSMMEWVRQSFKRFRPKSLSKNK